MEGVKNKRSTSVWMRFLNVFILFCYIGIGGIGEKYDEVIFIILILHIHRTVFVDILWCNVNCTIVPF